MIFTLKEKVLVAALVTALFGIGAAYVTGRLDGWAAKEAKIDAQTLKALGAAKAEQEKVLSGDRSKVKGFDRD